MPYLSIMAEFRDNVRTHARTLKATDILQECDRLRDDVLPNVGVRLEDVEGKCDFEVTSQSSLNFYSKLSFS